MKTKSQLRTAFIALMVVSQGSLAIPPDSSPFSDSYVMAGNPATTMDVRREGDQYQIELSGGGDELAGAATAADCFIHAEGKREGNRLAAVFTALETDTFSFSEREARSENRKLEVVFEPEGASVVHADTFGYCGLGATFEGKYRPKSAK
ncbi:MAG: hypothetical protein WCH01_09915 [Methylococcaceae bacterium]